MHTVDGAPGYRCHCRAHFKPWFLRLQNLKVPSIAACERSCGGGGGASLRWLAILSFAAKSAYFLQAFSRIGLTPDTGSTWSGK
ncbi:enoyl-CoA hydratase-related protein [Paraburkholderia dipogonis]|uniref:enoyl-CoA hydratase-related protein n=1 Tax=Paraburkholderia dipogonis TaxID=1211383 RepID=UPI0035E821B9